MFHLFAMWGVSALVVLVANDPTGFVWLAYLEFLASARHASRFHEGSWLARADGWASLAFVPAVGAVIAIRQAFAVSDRGPHGTVALLAAITFTQAFSYAWHRYQHERTRAWAVAMAATVPLILLCALAVRWRPWPWA